MFSKGKLLLLLYLKDGYLFFCASKGLYFCAYRFKLIKDTCGYVLYIPVLYIPVLYIPVLYIPVLYIPVVLYFIKYTVAGSFLWIPVYIPVALFHKVWL